MLTVPNSNQNATRLKELRAEQFRREEETLRLFRALPHALGFHLSTAPERVLRGGNQSSKTTSAAFEIASAATGIPLNGPDGKPMPFQYPNRPLLIWITGYDLNHIGSTIHHKLFEPGAIDVIRDSETGRLRAYRPWDPDDLARESEIEPAAPLIPPRMIDPKGWAWENKGERAFSVCRLKNGTEIRAFPSGGHCPMGRAVDIVWIDEDIQDGLERVQELRIRQGKVSGRFIWSAWPLSRNEALVSMSRRADSQKHLDEPDIEEWVLKYSDNPYIPDKQRKRILAGMTSDERRSRDLGEYLTDLQLVFPTFDLDVHGLPNRKEEDALGHHLSKLNYRIPDEWSHYLVIDPGSRHQGTLFLAVPPPEIGDYGVQYDEVYLENKDAMDLARAIRNKAGERRFEAFVIDWRAGRQTPMGLGKRVIEVYTEAFKKMGLSSYATGSGFFYGSDDVAARNMQVRQWLSRRADGSTKFRIIPETTPETQREFLMYRRQITRHEIKEKVDDRHNHLMDCLGYLAAFEPTYVRRSPKAIGSAVWLAYQKYRRNLDKFKGTVYLGPGKAEDARIAASL